MKGQVLDYSIQDGSGVISASDGARFHFSGTQWRGGQGGVAPTRGMWVDFEVSNEGVTGSEQAVAIYRSLTAGDAASAAASGIAPGKSKAAATLWAIFLGGFGAHKFYMGSWGWGIIYLLTCWLYVPFIAALVEWIRYVLMTDSEFTLKADAFKSKGPFGFFW
jgi:TM2 domain-containing membrane protein YozV